MSLSLWLALSAATPAVTLDSSGDVRRLHATVPGRLLGYALADGYDGAAGRRVYLLVQPQQPVAEDPPAKEKSDERRLPECPDQQGESLLLFELDPRQAQQLVPVRDDLPFDATMIDTADIDGDGRDELLLARPGELWEVPATGSLRQLVADEGLRWRQTSPRRVRHPSLQRDAWVTATVLGALTLYGPAEPGQPWRSLGRIELPVEASLRPGRIQVWTPRSRFIGELADGTLLFTVGPESIGNQRLKTFVIAVPPGDTLTGATLTESWSRLPEAEELLDRGFLIIGEKPVLLVTTKPAGKLSLFGEKKLRLYPLGRDRSRLGLPPLFAAETRMNHWQDATPRQIDVNGDGRDDLVLGYWKGLMDDRVVLDAYLAREDGSFESSPRSTGFDVKKGDRSFVQYGADLDGNGHADLLVRSKDDLLLFSGRPSSNGKKLVASKPRRLPLARLETEPGDVVVELSSGGGMAAVGQTPLAGRPRIVDIDGDGRDELVLLSRGGRGQPGYFRALWITGSSE